MNEGEVVSDHLELYFPGRSAFVPLVSSEDNPGEGQLSSDASLVVYSSLRGASLRLYDLRRKENKSLLPSAVGRIYAYPAWRPGTADIAFLALERSTRGLLSRLLLISAGNTEPKSIISDDPVAAFCFSPDGKQLAFLGAKGIEILDLATGGRHIAVQRARIQGKTYDGGGLTWSIQHDCVAIALSDQESKSFEIWMFALDGTTGKRIFGSSNRLRSLSFISK
jgi:WD40 repeat protein